MYQTYLNWLLINRWTVAAHLYMGLAILIGDLSPLAIILLSPVFVYAYLAFAVDLEEEGFCLAVFVGRHEDEPFIDHLAEEMHEETGRPVKIILYTRTENEVDSEDGNEENLEG